MFSKENVSIKINGSSTVKTELTNSLLNYDAFIEVEISSLDIPIEDCRLQVDFSGWTSFQSQEFEIDPHDFLEGATAIFHLAPIQLKSKETFTIKSDEPLQLSARLTHEKSESELRENKIITCLSPAGLEIGISPVYSVVFQQNQFDLINTLEVSNRSSQEFGLTKVIVECDPPEFEANTWNFDSLAPQQATRPQSLNLKISPSTLEKLTEKKEVIITFRVYVDDFVVCEKRFEVQLLPKNQWGGETHMPELLGAFVTPNTDYTNYLIRRSAKVLEKYYGDSRIDGYQSKDRKRPWQVAAALWTVISQEDITYCQPPASFAKGGQKIRLSHEIVKSRLSTCLDTALLFASCLEQAGLNPIVVLLDGHALVGLWLIDQSFSALTLSDPAELRNRIGLKDCILLETTLATNSIPVDFQKAIAEGERKVSEEHEKEFVYAIDIKQARSRKISPLEFGDGETERTAEKASREEIPLPVAPNLPSVDKDDEFEEETPQTRVDQWRRKLLDLTKRNPLLNIKKRASGFKILCPDIGILEDRLADEETFAFDSIDSLKTPGRSDIRFTAETGDSLKHEFVMSQLDNKKLIADCSINELDKQLISLFRKSKTDLEEGGSNTLFLTLGTLRWKEDATSDIIYRAPLILLPVCLKRSSAKARPRLSQHNAESAVFNLTLIQMLKQDFEIDLSVFQKDLPMDESGIDCSQIWSTVRSRIKETPGFEVVEELFLGTFSFSKYLMWKDLSDRIHELKQSALVDHLVERPSQNYPTTADFLKPEDADSRINPSEFYTPLNADSSQMVAIEASARGVDFVLEGPPGTGKSETIANIIAHNIAIGRKVLFVSEKMVALDVVYSRLKRVGLGHVCLELHSNKASPKNVKDQLNEAWQRREEAPQSEWKEKAIKLGQQRRELNDYVRALHDETSLGYTPFQAISKSLEHSETCRIDLEWERDLLNAPVKTKAERDKLLSLAGDIGLAYKDVEGLDSGIFDLIRQSSWSNHWNLTLVDKAKEFTVNLGSLHHAQSSYLELLSFEGNSDLKIESIRAFKALAELILETLATPLNFALEEDARQLLAKLGELAKLKKELADLCDASWASLNTKQLSVIEVEQLASRICAEPSPENYRDNEDIIEELEELGFPLTASSIDSKRVDRLSEHSGVNLPHNKIAELPVQHWITERDELVNKNWLSNAIGKRKLNKLICSHGLNKVEDFNILEDFKMLTEAIFTSRHNGLQSLLKRLFKVIEISRNIESIIKLFDHPSVQDRAVSPDEILRLKKTGSDRLEAIQQFAHHSENPTSFSDRIKILLRQQENSKLRESAENLISQNERFDEVKNTFCLAAKSPDLNSMRLSEIEKKLRGLIESSNMLNAWCRWMEHKEKAQSQGLTGLIRALEAGTILWTEAKSQTERALCKWATPLILDSCDTLKRFSATKHDDIIATFRTLDKEVADTTGAYIAALLASGLPESEGPNAPQEYGVLSRELQRQRNQLSVRNLIEQLGGFLLDLMPCFMMSPLSVAQYLPASYRSFDLVVFDEASQITVWDAVGAIARGKNAIVVGDPKQMPPSNNYQRQLGNNDEHEEDLESILDQAIAVRAGYHRLTGHYRSRHESLITFSNYKYYAGTLSTYPAPSDRQSMVSLRRVDGIYTKGVCTNPIEARAVVDEVLRRLNDPILSDQSIGIVTFNIEQKQLIENLLDDARKSNPKLERFFGDSALEPIFVKNLETVQGDQRDVIILSITFGPSEPGAMTMALNFGPMNKPGGERRLNVAATRSAVEMVLFSSFDPSMIDLSRTNAQGMRDLKEFMTFADKGPSSLARSVYQNTGVDEFDSAFEEDVATQLRKLGWKIQTQVGASKFKIDLGVYNPNVSGSFLAGVECDGATYHSSPTARDRDRVRHIILENLGWNLVRIWSTDYFLNSQKVMQRVHQELTELLDADTQRREEQKAAADAKPEAEGRQATEAEVTQKAESEEQISADEEEISLTQSHPEDQLQKPKTAIRTDLPNEPKEIPNDEENGTPYPQPDSEKDLSSEDVEQKIRIHPYRPYQAEPSQDPRDARAATIARTLAAIVRQEAPVTVGRAFRVYLAHCGIKKMGRNVRADLEKGLTYAVSSNQLEKNNEFDSNDSLQFILRVPGAHNNVLRKRGERSLEEIPPSEICLAAEYALLDDVFEKGSEEHCKRILEIFETKRLTIKTHAIIKEAIMKRVQ